MARSVFFSAQTHSSRPPRFPADAPSLLRGIPAPLGLMNHVGGRWPCSLQVSAISHTLELQPLTIHQSSPEPVSKLLSAGIPTCLLFVQAMMTSVPNSPRFAASYNLDCWPQTSTVRLVWPAFLFSAHHEVTSLLTARAASCDTQGTCAHDDP